MLRVALQIRAAELRRNAAEWGCASRRWACRATKPLRATESVAEKVGDGISHNIKYNSLWEQILTFPKRRPFATNIMVATVKTSAADLIVQTAEGREEIDWKRNGVFTAFGFAYLGIAQWFIYVSLFTRLCPNAIRFSNLSWAEKLKDKKGQIDLIKQTAYDNFVHYTFVYFPVFYVFKEVIQSGGAKSATSNEWPSPKKVVESALGKYWNNSVKDNLWMWSLWIPGDLMVYACPIWMRLPLNHGVSLIWTMILSNLRGSEK